MTTNCWNIYSVKFGRDFRLNKRRIKLSRDWFKHEPTAGTSHAGPGVEESLHLLASFHLKLACFVLATGRRCEFQVLPSSQLLISRTLLCVTIKYWLKTLFSKAVIVHLYNFLTSDNEAIQMLISNQTVFILTIQMKDTFRRISTYFYLNLTIILAQRSYLWKASAIFLYDVHPKYQANILNIC